MALTETFRVRDIEAGEEYLVVALYTDPHGSALDRRIPTPGEVHYRLADGTSLLRQINRDTFEILNTGRRVRRIS